METFLNDGKDHINIYTKGKTFLGRFLSNLYPAPVETKKSGYFYSAEALWYYLTREDSECFRNIKDPFTCKTVGRMKPKKKIDMKYVYSEMSEAIKYKVANNEPVKRMLRSSDKPFTHYYEYGGKKIFPQNQEWLSESVENLRKELNEN